MKIVCNQHSKTTISNLPYQVNQTFLIVSDGPTVSTSSSVNDFSEETRANTTKNRPP